MEEACSVQRPGDSAVLRVLLVEDSAADAEQVERVLRRGGYAPILRRVEKMQQMHNALDGESWDIVLADFTMRQFNAIEALKVLKDRNLDIPVIVLSGIMLDEVVAQALASGARDCISKNQLMRLLPVVTRELEAARPHPEAEIAEKSVEPEELLRNNEERFRLVAKLTTNAIWDWNLATGSLNWGSDDIFGYARDQIPAEITWRKERIHAEDGQRVWMGLYNAVQAKQNNWSDTYRFQCADGSYAMVIDRASIIYDEQGRPVRMVGAMEDISERHRLEQQLLQSQKMEAVGRLAAGVAHDFNNLLTAISGYTELLLLRTPRGHPSRADLGEISKASQRAAELTRQLLAFSRQQILRPKVIELNSIVINVEKMLRRLIGEDIELITRLNTDLRKVRVDPGQMEQVIVNLAVNARDAMPEGGRLTIETQNFSLEHPYPTVQAVVYPGNYVTLVVSDTGCGMDKEMLSRIFEPFFTTKGQSRGTGLGLSTVYGIIKQSGGFIWVSSKVGSGTTFKIYLPRTDAPTENLGEGLPEPVLTQGNETILLVEDEDLVRRLVKTTLASLGYRVIEAGDGPQALGIISEYGGAIDLLLTDVVMPQMSGKTLAQRIQQIRPGLKVLYMSGYTDDAIVHHGILEPGIAFVQKPFTPSIISAKVREVLAFPQ
jgi:two-component system, cell cycle sensor histidine kinase and response regulator CckA